MASLSVTNPAGPTRKIQCHRAPRAPGGLPRCGRVVGGTPNPKVGDDQVTTALKNANANISDVDVDYDKNERVIHLTGKVDSATTRARAEEVAERAVGTSGKVLNEVTIKGVNDRTADDNDSRIKDDLEKGIE